MVATELELIAEEEAIEVATGPGRALEGLVCLVTGAGGGIGAAVAERYAREGASLVLCGRDVDKLNAVAAKLKFFGAGAAVLPIDLAEPGAAETVRGVLAERIGRLDVLVLNHGILGPLSPLADMDEAAFDAVLNVNLAANVRLLSALDPLLRGSPSGRLIAVSSGAAEGGFAGWGAYGASNAGLEALVRAYAAEVREETSIRANIVDPGEVRTDMRASAFPDENSANLPAPEWITDVFVRLAAPACTLSGRRLPALARKA